MFVVKGRQKGQMQFSVTYRAPLPSADDMQALSFAEGEERVVQGKTQSGKFGGVQRMAPLSTFSRLLVLLLHLLRLLVHLLREDGVGGRRAHRRLRQQLLLVRHSALCLARLLPRRRLHR